MERLEQHLTQLDDARLTRFTRRAWARIDYTIWDWSTLTACHPGIARVLKLAFAELRRRRKA